MELVERKIENHVSYHIQIS